MGDRLHVHLLWFPRGDRGRIAVAALHSRRVVVTRIDKIEDARSERAKSSASLRLQPPSSRSPGTVA